MAAIPWLTFLEEVSIMSLIFTPDKVFFSKPSIASIYLKLHIEKFLEGFFQLLMITVHSSSNKTQLRSALQIALQKMWL